MRKPRRSQVLKSQALRVTTVRTGVKWQSSLICRRVSTETRAKIILNVDTLTSFVPELWEGKCLLSWTFTHLYNTHFLSRRHDQSIYIKAAYHMINKHRYKDEEGRDPPSTPMRVHTLLDRVGRLQVTVIHCLVYTSQGSLWHKDRLKLSTLHTEKDMAVSTAILGKTWMYWAEFLNNSEVISSLRTLTRTTPCQALW